MKQRIYGVVIILICLAIIFLAMQGTTPEEKDITPVMLLLPLGAYMMFTKTVLLYKVNSKIKIASKRYRLSQDNEPVEVLDMLEEQECSRCRWAAEQQSHCHHKPSKRRLGFTKQVIGTTTDKRF